MTRRALSPAAHGVLLAVRAALRGRVPQITDAPDGTTSVVVTDPDGTVLLRCAVRSVSRARDTRQPLLPLAPGAPHDPPAPVAMVRPEAPVPQGVPSAAEDSTAPAAQCTEAVAAQGDDDGPAPINGVCVGDKIHLDDEPIKVMGVDHEGFTWRTVATDAKGRSVDEGDVLWREVVEPRPGHWRVTEVEAKASREKPLRAKADAPSKSKRAVKAPETVKAGPALDDIEALWEIVLDDWPTPCRTLDLLDNETVILWTNADEKGAALDHIRTIVPGKHIPTIRVRAIDAGATVLREEPSDGPDHLVNIGEKITTPKGLALVMGVVDDGDENGAMTGLVLDGPDGPRVAWADRAKVAQGRVTIDPTRTWTAEREGKGWRAVRLTQRQESLAPAKPKAAPKSKPARLLSVPLADAVARNYRGAIVIAWQATEDAAWERVWSAASPKAAEIDAMWRDACAGHRARQYNRGGKCTRDSLDEVRS